MNSKKTVARHCENNILYIPQALYNMRDVTPLLYNHQSAIFHKELEQNLINIEFHTNIPCIVYIETGTEILTTCNDEAFQLRPNEAIFLPKGLNLYSDYINIDGPLSAYLIFFDNDVITEFLSTGTNIPHLMPNENVILKITKNPAITILLESLHTVYKNLNNSPQILTLKLLEILHLIDINDPENRLRLSLSSAQKDNPKRNIRRLMEKYIISNLRAKDFAALSGRSVSCFNREFKQLYDMTPKQWIIQQRLAHAHTLLVDKRWSVTATAHEVGYENISHFIAAFKQVYHKTPHQIKQHC